MLMQHPNKSRTSIIVESIKKKKSAPMGEETGGGGEEYREQKGPQTDTGAAKESAMGSFLAAVEKKDPRGMMRSLQTFYDLCAMGEEQSEGEESKPYDEEYA